MAAITRGEIWEQLFEKVEASWTAYADKMLALPSHIVFSKADEIAAVRLCYNELVGGTYSADLLEHLLRYDDPLDTMREWWLQEQNTDHSEEFEHALWTLKEQGPSPDQAMGGMTME